MQLQLSRVLEEIADTEEQLSELHAAAAATMERDRLRASLHTVRTYTYICPFYVIWLTCRQKTRLELEDVQDQLAAIAEQRSAAQTALAAAAGAAQACVRARCTARRMWAAQAVGGSATELRAHLQTAADRARDMELLLRLLHCRVFC